MCAASYASETEISTHVRPLCLIHVRLAGPDVATVSLIELLADAEHVQGLPYPPAAEQAGSKGAPG